MVYSYLNITISNINTTGLKCHTCIYAEDTLGSEDDCKSDPSSTSSYTCLGNRRLSVLNTTGVIEILHDFVKYLVCGICVGLREKDLN